MVHICHLRQQRQHVVIVTFGKTKLGAVISSINPGQPAKSVHAQPCVVSQRRQAAGARSMARFSQCIFDKGAVRLRRFRNIQLALANQAQAERSQHQLQFGKFANIVRRKNDFHACFHL